MTDNPRKLAWSIIKLFSNYSEEDIQGALLLIDSGELLNKPIRLAKAAANSERRPALSRTKPEDEKAKKLIENAQIKDRAELREFSLGISAKRYLKSQRSIRIFFSQFNSELPKKMPSRSNIALRAVEMLLRLDDPLREKALIAGQHIDERSNSSLAGWSNLIVKGDGN